MIKYLFFFLVFCSLASAQDTTSVVKSAIFLDVHAGAGLRLGEAALAGQVRARVEGSPGQEHAPWRIHAALVLAERADRTGVSVLAGALDACGNDVALCKRVLAALGRLKDRTALSALFPARQTSVPRAPRITPR